MTTGNFCFYSQNRLIQTSETGGQWYSDTSPFSIPWLSSMLCVLLADKARSLPKRGAGVIEHNALFVERWAYFSALFTFLVGWHVDSVSLPPGDVFLAQLACPQNDIIFCLHQE